MNVRPRESSNSHHDPPDRTAEGLENTVQARPIVLTPVEPVKAPRPSGLHDPGANRLLYACHPHPLVILPAFRHTPSSVEINFGNLTRIINLSEHALTNIAPYPTTLGNFLSAEMVQVYYGTITMYLTFRHMIRVRASDRKIEDFVRMFESKFDAKNLPVDGVIAPIIMSLTSSETVQAKYDQVFFSITPDIHQQYDWKNLCFRSHHLHLLPNIPLLLRIIRRQINGRISDQNRARRFENPYWNVTTEAIGTGPLQQDPLPEVRIGTGDPTTRYMRLMPGFNFKPPPIHRPADFALSDRCEWPDPVDPNKDDHDWFDFFGFTTTGRQHFFSELIKHVSERCHFMNSCCTLDDVTRSNSGCSKIELRLHSKYDTQYKMALSKDEVMIQDIYPSDQGSTPQVLIAIEPPAKKPRPTRQKTSTATTRTTRSETQSREPAQSTSKGKSATGQGKSSQKEAPASQSEDREESEEEETPDPPPTHREIEDLIFHHILTGRKMPNYQVRFALRENPVPDTAIRMALLTEFTAPPLTIITNGHHTNTYHGPFWNSHVLDIGNPIDSLDNIDRCISSDYVRLQSVRSKL